MAAEKHVEDRIKSGLQKLGVYFYKNFSNGFTKKGIPDIVGCSKNGHFFAVEVKRVKGGKPTPVQIRNLALIAKNKGRAFLACGNDVVPLVNLSWRRLAYLYHNGVIHVIPIDYNKKLRKLTAKEASNIWHRRPRGCQVVMIVCHSVYNRYFR